MLSMLGLNIDYPMSVQVFLLAHHNRPFCRITMRPT